VGLEDLVRAGRRKRSIDEEEDRETEENRKKRVGVFPFRGRFCIYTDKYKIMREKLNVIPNQLQTMIFIVRGEKVMLDFHLSGLYEIETRALKQQVRRKIERFPIDFLIILTDQEWKELITNCDNLGAYKYAPSPPFAFTEQGVAMLSSVLKSQKAIEVNIAIMRTFVQIRKMMTESADLNRRIDSLESRYDEQFQSVFAAIRQLLDKKSEPRRAIGYRIPGK
jgi:hypothetical protein